MRMTSLLLVLLAVSVVSPLRAQQPPNAQVLTAVQNLIGAQETFDVARMDQVLAPDYVEISPLGEVDPRAKVLGFYAPDKKPAAGTVPHLTLDETEIRAFGDTAVLIGRVRFTPQGATEPAGGGMRVTFVLRSSSGQWRVVSSQYTPIRSKP